mmetsp:Transcript_9924/g.16685  ORF Transcript_9924/g.16685 Transcript_9924/m.16685 type:complete len:88 (+) Transcript_9924:58-321(+)
MHQKYENEVDTLLLGDDNHFEEPLEVVPPSKAAFENNSEMSNSDNQEQRQGSQVFDKRKMLLKLLDQQNGEAKQVFNFEEEENNGFG